MAESGDVVTYAELESRAARVARALRAAGLALTLLPGAATVAGRRPPTR